VSITRGACPSRADCNFEQKTLCGYKNADDNDFNWVVLTGISPNPSSGPVSDHTQTNSQGSYAFLSKISLYIFHCSSN
jgi:hypothetical protein